MKIVRLRRRHILVGMAGLGGVAALKAGGRMLLGPKPVSSRKLAHLSARQESIVVAVAIAMVGPRAEAAYADGRWDPAAHVDGLLAHLADDQRQALGVGIHLLEEWCWGLTGFTGLSRVEQLRFLSSWRTSGLAIKRSLYSVLHAMTSSSFAACEAGSKDLMGHPGPCVGTVRAPGQSAHFQWDEAVP